MNTATFANSGGGLVSLPTSALVQLKSLSFVNSATSFTLSAGTLSMSNSAGAATISAAGSQTINSSVQLASATQMSTTNGSDVLAVGGQVTGSGGLTTSGAGIVSLSNATNTYSGGTTLGGGLLQIPDFNNGNTYLGSASPANSASLVLNGGLLSYAGSAGPQVLQRAYSLTSAGGGFDASAAASSATVTVYSGLLHFAGAGNTATQLAGIQQRIQPIFGELEQQSLRRRCRW